MRRTVELGNAVFHRRQLRFRNLHLGGKVFHPGGKVDLPLARDVVGRNEG